MSVTVMPNRGIMLDDRLDKLRSDAVWACRGGIPAPLVHYLHALEAVYIDSLHKQHHESLREIGWTPSLDGDDPV